MTTTQAATAVIDRPYLYDRREIFEVTMGGTTASNVSSQTGRASEHGPDD
ncbi:hypothetical protein MYK68_08355 [Gordonia sp. PP30]|nr:hypothetical protein [Gordonia sp. PP30]UQE76559.1 hypothetical protein MYK68_08355 [Gordonia sp. PP30]